MELDYDNGPGLQLLEDILQMEEYKKNGNQDLTVEKLDEIAVKRDNILHVALENDFTFMVYMTDQEKETKVANPERQKVTFETTSNKEVEKVNLMKDYFATGNLKPLQDYLDNLLEG